MIFVASRCHVGHNGYQTQIVQPRQARGGPDQLTMPDHDTGRRQRLDRRDSLGAEKALQAIQVTLPVEHQPHNLPFRRLIASTHRRNVARADNDA